jgi:hypothetical protein
LRGAAGRQLVRANEELKMREVLVFDDDYTPMEFVVTVLEQVIQKSREEASTIRCRRITTGSRSLASMHRRKRATWRVRRKLSPAKRTPVVLRSRGRRIDGLFERP